MKLYYHKTDGGAEYYSTDALPGTDEGDLKGTIMRTDGDEIEIFIDKLKAKSIRLVIS